MILARRRRSLSFRQIDPPYHPGRGCDLRRGDYEKLYDIVGRVKLAKYVRALGALLMLLTASAAAAQPNLAVTTAQPLSRAAFIATMDGEFRKLDANHDGVATRAEVDAQQQRLAAATVTQRARSVFAQLDADHNGQVSVDEFVRANLAQMRKVDSAAVMNRLDTNHDAKVSAVEYRILTLAGFDRLDVDRDGVLTVQEQRAGGLAK